MSLLDSKNVKIINVPVEGDTKAKTTPQDDIHKIDNEVVDVKSEVKSEIYQPVVVEEREERNVKKSRERRSNEGKLFVAFILLGIGFTTLVEGPFPLFLGIALAFISTMDPVYQKIMDRINKL
ncbi:MAG: hypothetical protein ACKVTZ_13175 [Bacteroidia bacterium]